jgi:hypothetical protein
MPRNGRPHEPGRSSASAAGMTVIVIGASPWPYIWVTMGPSTLTAVRRSSWYSGAPPTTTLRRLGRARPRACSTTRLSIVGARKAAWVTWCCCASET